MDNLSVCQLSGSDLMGQVSQKTGYSSVDVPETVQELCQVHAIRDGSPISTAPQQLPEHFPLQTLVMNLTNQCNLSCQYCYEFGEDKIATPEGKKKFMD